MDKFLNLINQDYISNIYIGITGILVAIVIFIAEVIKDQNNELNKKIILSKTGIKMNSIFLLIIFFYMLVINMFVYDVNLSINCYTNISYILTHCLLLILVIISLYTTGRVFLIALKLNTEKDYFNKSLEEYVYRKVPKLEKKANKKGNKKHKKEEKEFRNFLKKQKVFFIDKAKIKDITKYEAVYPIKSGIVGRYDYKKLNEFIEYFNNNKINEEEYNSQDEEIVFIPNKIGKNVNKKDPVFYYLEKYKNIFKNLNDAIIYRDNRLFINDEIKLINSCLFELASNYEEPDYFDENSRLFNYFKYLYDNQLYGIKSLAFDNIEEMYRKIYYNYSKNRQFSHFLNSLSFLAYSYDEYSDYERINTFELFLYIYQLEDPEVNTKKTTYDFINNVFKFNLYSVKKNPDIKYYDNLMAMLLKFIIQLIKKNDYGAIDVLFDNILMERINYKDNDFDEYDIINFQFSCGIIYCFVMLSRHENINKESYNTIKRIINYIDNFMINLYDAWETVNYFKNYFDKITSVQKAYSNLDFEFVDHEYKSSWGGWGIDTRIILKELLYILNIDFVNIDIIDKNSISKDDKYYYKELLRLIEDNEYSELDKFLNITYNKEQITKALYVGIEEAEKKEKEFNRINELNEDKLHKFEASIKNSFNKNSRLINELSKYTKVKKSNKKLKNVFGINQLIPRTLFFDNVSGYETIADNYCGALDRGIEREYIKKIEKMSQKASDSLKNILSKIDNLQEFVLISNYINNSFFREMEYDYSGNSLIINDKKISIINIPGVEGVFLLKKEDLPEIEFCKFDNEWDNNKVYKSLFYEIIDCSKDEKLRQEIISCSEWLKEKGTEKDQDNYLRECCRIRLFISYKINKMRNSSALKFDIKEQT